MFYHKKESGGSGKPEKNRENDLQMYHRSLLKAHSLALFHKKYCVSLENLCEINCYHLLHLLRRHQLAYHCQPQPLPLEHHH